MKALDYLLDPHKAGVYRCSFDIAINDAINLLETAVDFDKSKKRQPENYSTLRFREHEDGSYGFLIGDLREVLDHLDVYRPEKDPLGPWQLKKPSRKVLTEKELRWLPILEETMITKYPSPSCFLEKYQAALDKENAISLDLAILKSSLRFSICSLKEEGISAYKEFLESIPIIGKNVKTSNVAQKFSSRYCYKIYPYAMILWIYEVGDNPIPKDLLQYFIGAIRYYEQSEWRVSIILAAISVETILAEVYEEIMHKPAPPDTLGSLFSQVSKALKIPTEIKADIEEVNNNRILAVHRNSKGLGGREAMYSLVGATRFTHWMYTYGPFSK